MWKTVEGFGQIHLMLPSITRTVCGYVPNPNSGIGATDNLALTVDCVECLHFAQVMHIPTAVLDVK